MTRGPSLAAEEELLEAVSTQAARAPSGMLDCRAGMGCRSEGGGGLVQCSLYCKGVYGSEVRGGGGVLSTFRYVALQGMPGSQISREEALVRCSLHCKGVYGSQVRGGGGPPTPLVFWTVGQEWVADQKGGGSVPAFIAL